MAALDFLPMRIRKSSASCRRARSSAAVTAMVPNSLGPGELLLQFGTKAQQDYWLPRLARRRGNSLLRPDQPGSRLGCRFDGRLRRGLPRHLRRAGSPRHPAQLAQALHHARADRDGAGSRLQTARSGSSDRPRDDIGITLALVPTHLPGVSIGRRHLPAMHVFQNGPNWGRDVFIPMDHVIGGVDQVGKGWKMLMSALAAGRGISLPSLSAAGARSAPHSPAPMRASASSSMFRSASSRRSRSGSGAWPRLPICSMRRAG